MNGNMVMELVLLFLPWLLDPTFVNIVLSNIFVQCILIILSDENTLLHKATLHCVGEIQTWVKEYDVHKTPQLL